MATTATLTPPRTRRARLRRGSQPYLYLLPAFAVMALIVFYPLIYQVWMSFHEFGLKNFRTVNPVPAEFIGLDNYIRVATSKLQIPNFEFVRLVLFNLFWAFSNVVVHVILGVIIALVLNTPGLKFKRFWRSLYIIPVGAGHRNGTPSGMNPPDLPGAVGPAHRRGRTQVHAGFCAQP